MKQGKLLCLSLVALFGLTGYAKEIINEEAIKFAKDHYVAVTNLKKAKCVNETNVTKKEGNIFFLIPLDSEKQDTTIVVAPVTAEYVTSELIAVKLKLDGEK